MALPFLLLFGSPSETPPAGPQRIKVRNVTAATAGVRRATSATAHAANVTATTPQVANAEGDD